MRYRRSTPLLQRLDFIETPHVPLLAGECRMQEGGGEFTGKRRPDHTRAQDEHIHVVMFHTLVRRIGIMTDCLHGYP